MALGIEAKSAGAPPPQVAVLDEKTVAGFHAVVLEAQSAKALVGWLEEHHYAFSPQIEAWAKPYVEGGWKITALKVAKDKSAAAAHPNDEKRVAAAALRMSFKTERPLFPYREPDYGALPPAMLEHRRLLRIYFIGDARYDGALEKDRIDAQCAARGLERTRDVGWQASRGRSQEDAEPPRTAGDDAAE